MIKVVSLFNFCEHFLKRDFLKTTKPQENQYFRFRRFFIFFRRTFLRSSDFTFCLALFNFYFNHVDPLILAKLFLIDRTVTKYQTLSKAHNNTSKKYQPQTTNHPL